MREYFSVINGEKNIMNQLQREITAMQYLSALENADHEALIKVLDAAEKDRDLESMIVELQTEWAVENNALLTTSPQTQWKNNASVKVASTSSLNGLSKIESAQLKQQAEFYIDQYSEDANILAVLAEFYSSPTNGYDALSSANKSGVNLTAGTLFRLLPMLVRDGLLEESPSPANAKSKKQHFQATSLGKTVAQLLVKREQARSQTLYAYYVALFGI